MSGIELNKVAAAILVAGLVAMITGKVTDALYHTGGHHGEEEKRGYQVAGVDISGGESAGTPAAAEPEVNILTLLPAADAKAGETVSKKCTSCHDFTKGGPNKVGPNLWGIVGDSHARSGDFAYSPAFVALKGKPWDFESLSEFLNNPQKAVPGTKMGFAGIKKAQDRANLLAYLRSLSDSPVAIPAAPAAAPAPAAEAPPVAAENPDATTGEAPKTEDPEPAEPAKH